MECQLSTVQSLVFTAALPALLALPRGVRGPQGQVVPQQLHDQGAVLVAVLVQSVQLRDGVIKGLKLNVLGLLVYMRRLNFMFIILKITCLASWQALSGEDMIS